MAIFNSYVKLPEGISRKYEVSGQIILNPKAGFQQIEPSAGVGSQRRTKYLWLCPGIGYPKIRLLLTNSPQKLAIWV